MPNHNSRESQRITEGGNAAKLHRWVGASGRRTSMHILPRRFIPHYFSCSTLIFRWSWESISAGNTNSAHFKTNYRLVALGKRLKCISYLQQPVRQNDGSHHEIVTFVASGSVLLTNGCKIYVYKSCFII